MRSLFILFLTVGVSACGLFSSPDNRRPHIAWAQMFVVDTTGVFEVTMLAGAGDPDGNLERIDCAGDLDYSGPPPADTTVTFPFSDAGRVVFSNCFATDSEGAMSDTLLLFRTLPAPTDETSETASRVDIGHIVIAR